MLISQPQPAAALPLRTGSGSARSPRCRTPTPGRSRHTARSRTRSWCSSPAAPATIEITAYTTRADHDQRERTDPGPATIPLPGSPRSVRPNRSRSRADVAHAPRSHATGRHPSRSPPRRADPALRQRPNTRVPGRHAAPAAGSSRPTLDSCAHSPTASRSVVQNFGSSAHNAATSSNLFRPQRRVRAAAPADRPVSTAAAVSPEDRRRRPPPHPSSRANRFAAARRLLQLASPRSTTASGRRRRRDSAAARRYRPHDLRHSRRAHPAPPPPAAATSKTPDRIPQLDQQLDPGQPNRITGRARARPAQGPQLSRIGPSSSATSAAASRLSDAWAVVPLVLGPRRPVTPLSRSTPRPWSRTGRPLRPDLGRPASCPTPAGPAARPASPASPPRPGRRPTAQPRQQLGRSSRIGGVVMAAEHPPRFQRVRRTDRGTLGHHRASLAPFHGLAVPAGVPTATGSVPAPEHGTGRSVSPDRLPRPRCAFSSTTRDRHSRLVLVRTATLDQPRSPRITRLDRAEDPARPRQIRHLPGDRTRQPGDHPPRLIRRRAAAVIPHRHTATDQPPCPSRPAPARLGLGVRSC